MFQIKCNKNIIVCACINAVWITVHFKSTVSLQQRMLSFHLSHCSAASLFASCAKSKCIICNWIKETSRCYRSYSTQFYTPRRLNNTKARNDSFVSEKLVSFFHTRVYSDHFEKRETKEERHKRKYLERKKKEEYNKLTILFLLAIK